MAYPTLIPSRYSDHRQHSHPFSPLSDPDVLFHSFDTFTITNAFKCQPPLLDRYCPPAKTNHVANPSLVLDDSIRSELHRASRPGRSCVKYLHWKSPLMDSNIMTSCSNIMPYLLWTQAEVGTRLTQRAIVFLSTHPRFFSYWLLPP